MYIDVCGRRQVRFKLTYLAGLTVVRNSIYTQAGNSKNIESLTYNKMFDDKTNSHTWDHKY